jgi:hypothetical protein
MALPSNAPPSGGNRQLQSGSPADRSVDPCRHASLDALDEPRQCVLPTIEDDTLLQDMVKVDVQAAMTIEYGNRPAAVDVGPKLRVVEGIGDSHGFEHPLLLCQERRGRCVVPMIGAAIHVGCRSFTLVRSRAVATCEWRFGLAL